MTYSNDGLGLNKPTATPDPDGNFADGTISNDGQFVWSSVQYRWLPRFDMSEPSTYTDWQQNNPNSGNYDPAAHSAYYMGHGGGGTKKRPTWHFVAAGVGTAVIALGLIGIANWRADRPVDCTGTADGACFLQALDDQEIPHNDDQTPRDANNLGNATCTLLEEGYSKDDVASVVREEADLLSRTQLDAMIDLVAVTYCPDEG